MHTHTGTLSCLDLYQLKSSRDTAEYSEPPLVQAILRTLAQCWSGEGPVPLPLCVPCRGSCWPQGTVADQVCLEFVPFTLAVAEGGREEAFQSLLHLHSFCVSPNLLLNPWMKSCELKLTELNFFPTKTSVLQEITLFYKENKQMNYSDLKMLIYQKAQCEEGMRDLFSEWVCSSE